MTISLIAIIIRECRLTISFTVTRIISSLSFYLYFISLGYSSGGCGAKKFTNRRMRFSNKRLYETTILQ
nr:MAG TPA: hypothetical protein [Caudoviricetes sp.]